MAGDISRQEYAARYGPTAGDRIRLGDTNLLALIERDDTRYGDEVLRGWGKTMRTGLMMNDRLPSASRGIGSSGLLGGGLSLADYVTEARAPTHEATAVGGSTICLRSWCLAGAKGRRCTAHHPHMDVMRRHRQTARLGSLGPAEFAPSRDS